jgi:hypothetical protein
MTDRLTFLLVAVIAGAAGCAALDPNAAATRSQGWHVPLGKATATSYAEFDSRGAPTAIGVALPTTALDGLPAGSDNHHCTDRGHDGSVAGATQCIHTFEHVIPLPDSVARRADIPFKWVLFNWNPVGHIPPGIYDVPHFDIHFVMVPIAEIFAIEPGPCGPERVRCDQFEIGRKPLPPNYVHADFRDVSAVVPAMGNHLIDVTGPVFNKQPFTHSFIYGVYDGNVIFYEQMVTREYLLGKPNGCTPIKSPRAVAAAGYYPTLSCMRSNSAGEITVSMEGFAFRDASPPDPIAATPPDRTP